MDKKFYVTGTDVEKSSTNGIKYKLVCICDNITVVMMVLNRMQDNKKFKNVNFCKTKPKYYRTTKGKIYKFGDIMVENHVVSRSSVNVDDRL